MSFQQAEVPEDSDDDDPDEVFGFITMLNLTERKVTSSTIKTTCNERTDCWKSRNCHPGPGKKNISLTTTTTTTDIRKVATQQKTGSVGESRTKVTHAWLAF